MTEQKPMGGERGENLIDFMSRFTASEQFAKVFEEGMALVEETADYLDGPGRQEARQLDRAAALAYAAESMRLTTRLMQMASWLLLQKAVSSGELSEDTAKEEQERITIEHAEPADSEMLAMLPEGLRDLIHRAQALHDRIARLDEMIRNRETPVAENPVASQMEMLARAFGTMGGE